MDSTTKKRLLKIRSDKKRKNPSFERVESWRRKKVKPSWRKARGIDNKTRRKTKTGVKSPEPGYRTPKDVRDLHPSGLIDVRVMHKTDLEGLNPEIHGIRIAKRLGAKKKLDLIEFAREEGFRILNIGISKSELTDLGLEEEHLSFRKEQIRQLKENDSESDDEDEENSDADVEETD